MSAYEIKWFTRTPFRRALGAVAVLASAILLLSLAGCEISKTDKDGKKGVEINTPFGDLKVKNQADAKSIGLPVYPGATPKPSDHGNNSDASVSLSVLSMKLEVRAYLSDDSPDKVAAWYRDQLKPMGNFIECTGTGEVGNVHMDGKGGDEGEDKPVTCDKGTVHSGGSVADNVKDNVRANIGRNVTEFKMGTQRNQRVVGISTRKDGKPGTEFAIVRVVLGKGGKQETL